MTPKKITKPTPIELAIEWNDGHSGVHNLSVLRKYCPCASCKQEMESDEGTFRLPVLIPGQNELHAIEPIGNYAFQMTWADGHRTGIYTYEYLRQICECGECMRTTSE